MANTEAVMRLEDLVSTESLGISVLAGRDGLSREVLWAHSCEMSAPERWLGPHELLLTVGLCIPQRAEDQAAFVERLDMAGLSGLMVGDHDIAPPLSDDMLAAADRLGFPILLTAAEIPYAVVSRHVAAATSSSQILQVLKLSKLYQVSANAQNPEELITSLSTLLRVGLVVEDGITRMSVLDSDSLHLGAAGCSQRRYPLRGRHPADLLVLEHEGEPLDSFILVHLMKVLEVGVDRLLDAARLRAERSANALSLLLSGAEAHDADDLLGGFSIADGYHLVAFTPEAGQRVALSVALREAPVLVGPGRTSHLALLPRAAVESMKKLAMASDIRFGVSSVFTDYRDARAAAEEAAKVLVASRHSDNPWVEFEGTTIAVFARSLRDSEEIISGVLGTLAGPGAAAEKLRETLFAYLRNDRHWQITADELGIHRQTLSYRLNRIEEETGMSATRSADLAAFWIAYQAWEATQSQ
ncbi:PucR family transcriptional regulator [Herbiconiux sp.]|uniref:PucR family transcriptional regulator n=1 Tax=Herbiconiux sp. TaxID=1871186 RepID=UPI0025C41CB5|nr:PucR family transcriptional regulator [Herbiconiux sp.]